MNKSYLYATVTVLIWATNATVTKAVLFDIPNLQALSISSFFAFLFLLLINLKRGFINRLRSYSIKEYGIMSGLGFLGLFVYSALYFYGLTKLSAQEACVLNYLWPIMIVLFSCVLLKERMTLMKMTALGCSFLGIIILSLGKNQEQTDGSVIGIICCIIAAACYGLFSVLNKKRNYDQSIMMMISWLVTAVSSFILGILTETWVSIQGVSWIGIIWLGISIDAIAYLLWALALRGFENTAAIANLAYLVPFLSVIVSAVFLHEMLQIQAVIALFFIIGGILLQYFVDNRLNKSI